MKRIFCIFFAVILLCLCACKEKTPLSTDEPTTTTVETQEEKPPSIVLNDTHTLEVGSKQWSYLEGSQVVKSYTAAPHPHTYVLEKHPTLFAKKGKENTVSFPTPTETPLKEVQVAAYRMSETDAKAISVEVQSDEKKGTSVYSFSLLDDDYYAYVITLYWERHGNTDYASYYIYSKVK